MSEHILINGKAYLPSTALSAEFGYTSDYIGKLAREEKILGIQIDRQWFIAPESLRMHLHKIATEKEIKKEALRAIRKKERITHEHSFSHKYKKQKFAALTHGLSAVAVVACGVFTAGLSSLAHQNGLGLPALLYGAVDAGRYVAGALIAEPTEEKKLVATVPVSSDYKRQADEVVKDVPPQSEVTSEVIPHSLEVAYTRLPALTSSEDIPEVVKGTSVTPDESVFSGDVFSDEVIFRTDTNGNVYVVPRMREGAPHKTFTQGVHESASRIP
jgi:hypothetical protein